MDCHTILFNREKIMKGKETVTVRPKFRLTERQYKSMIRATKIMDISMSEYIRMQVKLALDGGK
jgi:hypothetical protein